jgi:hypothetical protein
LGDYCLAEITKEKIETKSLVQYASIVTARARIKLYKTLKEVETEGGRLLYCDTDSIFASFRPNFEKNKSKIKWEEKTILDAVFVNTRVYSLLHSNNELSYT